MKSLLAIIVSVLAFPLVLGVLFGVPLQPTELVPVEKPVALSKSAKAVGALNPKRWYLVVDSDSTRTAIPVHDKEDCAALTPHLTGTSCALGQTILSGMADANHKAP